MREEMINILPGGFSLLPWAVSFTFFQKAREGRKEDWEAALLQLNQKV